MLTFGVGGIALLDARDGKFLQMLSFSGWIKENQKTIKDLIKLVEPGPVIQELAEFNAAQTAKAAEMVSAVAVLSQAN